MASQAEYEKMNDWIKRAGRTAFFYGLISIVLVALGFFRSFTDLPALIRFSILLSVAIFIIWAVAGNALRKGVDKSSQAWLWVIVTTSGAFLLMSIYGGAYRSVGTILVLLVFGYNLRALIWLRKSVEGKNLK